MTKYVFTLPVLLFLYSLTQASIVVERQDRFNASLNQVVFKPQPLTTIAGNEAVVTLFSMHGSNTIGGSLGPQLAMSYLLAKGVNNVRIQPSLNNNESVIKGDLIRQGKTVQIKVAAHGSSTGFQRLVDSDAEIWASSRPIKDKEVKQVAGIMDLRLPKSEHILGIDGLAIIVNPSNPLTSLSTSQLKRIFSGQVKNWSEIGGENQKINLYARDENSGTWDSFKSMVLDGNNTLSAHAVRFESSEVLVERVVGDNGGIGFIGMAFVGESKLLAISDGTAQAFKPNELTVATEDYALSRRLFLYKKPNGNNPFVEEFMAYSQSIKGQDIVRNEGFISQNIVSMDMNLNSDLPQDYLALVNGAKRLSINFRFNEGSAKLDNKAKKDIQRLAYYLRSTQNPQLEDFDNHLIEIMLIGFGDKRKSSDRSKLLSKLRAMAVRRELAKLGIHSDVTTGYGDFNPVAGFNGHTSIKNRRVEVWVK